MYFPLLSFCIGICSYSIIPLFIHTLTRHALQNKKGSKQLLPSDC
ncbi:hypothetical protein CHCC5027_3065 [Bacillus paralicheniformis]|uniref:Uncharacterized protein n=1 Tax=Bacillus paralicheniformis TaxID=1648923 RepID=A0ABY3FQI7_9BACI|nr:hypothetical protein CHCC5027_3065 [Bacillus paralicheniformis]TWL33844.1 hypothetical protein CHCC15381_0351 [Bacillus paralicheniformis]